MGLSLADLTVGQWVSITGYGVRCVVAIESGKCHVAEDREAKDGYLTFRADQVASRFSVPMDRSLAREIEEMILSGGAPERGDGVELSMRADDLIKRGDVGAQSELLRGLYQLPEGLLYGPREAVLQRLEVELAQQIGHVTRRKPETVVRRWRKGRPAFGYVAPERDGPLPPPPPAAPAPWEVGVSLRVYADLVIGEYPSSRSRDAILVPGCSGIWHTYVREVGSAITWVAVHESVALEFGRLLEQVVRVGTVNCEGGCVHIVDSEVRDDKAYQRKLEEGDGGGRGASLGMGGDGPNAVSVLSRNGQAVLVTVTEPDVEEDSGEPERDDQGGAEVPDDQQVRLETSGPLKSWWRRLLA